MMHIKREYTTMDDYPRDYYMSQSPPADPSIRICSVTNENWRGKNDPQERRRIQNRLNQRAFRQRQRAGESPKLYKARTASSEPSSEPGDEGSPAADEEDETEESQPTSAPSNGQPSGSADPSTGRVWDELARLINRNLLAAAAANVNAVGIDIGTLQSATPAVTPRSANCGLAAALQPVQLQYQVVHDPIIDGIPHPRLRYNILRAIAAGQMDATTFANDLRASGALTNVQGQWMRGGMVVWSSPEQLASWELSELWIRRFSQLLQGCDDLLAATNAWRSRRGERLFPTSLTGK